MFNKLFFKIAILSSVLICLSSQAEMTESDKKLMVGTLYLSHCVYADSDFRKASDGFDMKNLSVIPPKDKNESQYIDGWVKARITLQEKMCLVEIKSKDIDKMASSLPSILEVAGGKLSISKIDDRYEGTLINNGKTIEVEAAFVPTEPNIMMIGLFTK